MHRDMGRPPEQPRVLGPYRHGPHRFTIEVRLGPRSEDGAREVHSYRTEGEAQAAKAVFERYLPRIQRARTFKQAIEAYGEALTAKGNRPGSIKLTLHRLGIFFAPVLERDMVSLKPTQAAGLYQSIVPKYKPDTHRNTLAEARSFLKWCVKMMWIPANPLDGIEGQGRRNKGKPGLYTGEARTLYRWCLYRGSRGDMGAIAVLMELVLGMRALEICTRLVRDVDAEGSLLWIPCSKTKAGKRTLEVPEKLARLLAMAAHRRKGTEYLFPAESKTGHHTKDWPRAQAQRLCEEAGVPVVGAHGLRGTQSSIARETGVTGRLVAQTLGHESETMHEIAYARKDAVEKGRTRRALAVLESSSDGGRTELN